MLRLALLLMRYEPKPGIWQRLKRNTYLSLPACFRLTHGGFRRLLVGAGILEGVMGELGEHMQPSWRRLETSWMCVGKYPEPYIVVLGVGHLAV
eukprot:1658441-Pyramimonas_sp.AAC.1